MYTLPSGCILSTTTDSHRTFLSALDLVPTAVGLQPLNHAAGYLIANFTLSYLILNSRLLKLTSGLDDNTSPRQNIPEKGERMVADGKITRRRLNLMKRAEGAHANSMEHFPLFVGTMLFALHVDLPASHVNMMGALYTLSRTVYAIAYLTIENRELSIIRTLAWWASNIICLRALAICGKSINS